MAEVKGVFRRPVGLSLSTTSKEVSVRQDNLGDAPDAAVERSLFGRELLESSREESSSQRDDSKIELSKITESDSEKVLLHCVGAST